MIFHHILKLAFWTEERVLTTLLCAENKKQVLIEFNMQSLSVVLYRLENAEKGSIV